MHTEQGLVLALHSPDPSTGPLSLAPEATLHQTLGCDLLPLCGRPARGAHSLLAEHSLLQVECGQSGGESGGEEESLERPPHLARGVVVLGKEVLEKVIAWIRLG